MTDIDWAILETNRLIGIVPDGAYRSDMIAAALRKAKADGLREAADDVQIWSYFLTDIEARCSLEELSGKLSAAASKLDPPAS